MALQKLCLYQIVDAFDRYYSAYTITKDPNLKLGFEFLQRKHSFELASLLKNKNILQEKYIDWVINKYLKVLDTRWFSDCSLEVILKKFAEIGPGLKKVYFNLASDYWKNHLSPLQNIKATVVSWKNVMCHLPNVKAIYYQIFCDNEVLESVAKYCSNLEVLDIKYSYHVSDDGLEHFGCKGKEKSPCSKLKEIYVKSTPVSDKGIKYLMKNIPSLERIDYPDLCKVLYSIHVSDVNALHKSITYNLTVLDVYTQDFDYTDYYNDVLKICVSLCPRLKSLSCTVFNLEHLNLCSTLSDVKIFSLDCCDDACFKMDNFLKQKGEKLTSLEICNCFVSVSVLAKCCPHLNNLKINGVNFEYDENESIPIFHNLETLVFEDIHYLDPVDSKSICQILSSCVVLEKLCIKKWDSSFPFTSELKTEILKCSERCPLKYISFDSISVEAKLFKDIFLTCSSLQTLNLFGCGIENEIKEDLYRLTNTLQNRPEVIINEKIDFNVIDFERIFTDDDDHMDYDNDHMDYDDDHGL